MNRIRNILRMCAVPLFTLGALSGMLAPVPVSAQTTPIVMKIGSATLNDAQHEWMKHFAALVNADSKGRLDVQIYPGSQLGSIPRMIEQAQFGAIQGYVGVPDFLVGVDPRYQIIGTPGVFTSFEQLQKVTQDPAFNKAFLAIGANKGLKGLALWPYGVNALITRKPVKTLADLKNLKVRILAGATQQAMMTAFGAVGVPMPLDQVLVGLQQGAIDGTFLGIATGAPLKYYSAAPYVLEINEPIVGDICVINKDWFEKLPKDLQDIVSNDGAKAARELYSFTVAFDERQKAAWLAGGGQVFELSPADRAAFHAKLAPIGEEVYKDQPAVLEFFHQMKAVAAKYK